MKIKTIYQKNYKGKILSIIQILLMTILSFYICHMVFAWPIPDSGLTTSYNDEGNVIPCPKPTVPGGLGGAETISELLKISPKVKAVVSSGYSNDPVMANFRDYGFCGIISKPYTKRQLADLLNKIFDKNV